MRNQAGRDEYDLMTRYFMRDTPLCQMEQQMMTPPYFKPRGHGRYYPGFQYSRDDMECPYQHDVTTDYFENVDGERAVTGNG